jgi:menaquinone-dependent protoporphyrinogen IX oxidase
MNERLQNLAREAGYFEFNKWDYFDINKFAELIVRECVTKLKETKKVELPFIQAVNEHAQELPLSVYIAELKQHFRVEE